MHVANKKAFHALTPVSKTKTMSKLRSIITIIILLFTVLSPITAVAQSSSDLQRQIDQLNARVEKRQSELDKISQQANTLENKLRAIEAEISGLQAAIDKANLQITQTQRQIQEAIAKLEKQKSIMFENARVLYKMGNPTTIEILASSDNFSEFINRQEYLETVKDSVNEAAQEIIALKEQLESKQKDLLNYTRELKTKQGLVQVRRDEQANLLAQTRGQESEYQRIVSADRAKLAKAREALAAYAASQSDVQYGSFGYPYHIEPWSFDMCASDPWGYCKRHCTSYTAWKVNSTHGYMPSWAPNGNAAQWPSNARADGIPTGFTPKRHAAAVDSSVAPPYGHVMFVEEVLSSGQIRVSQYNADGTGQGSMATISTVGLEFIYF